MLLIVIATLLILGVAFFQTTQGLFAAIIHTFLTVLAAAFALNYYEAAGRSIYEGHAQYADALMLTLLFGGPLLLARLIIDRFLKGNVVFGQWTDRIGCGIFGLVSGTIMVGVLVLALQMMPFGAGVLTYHPYNNAFQRTQRLWPFCPDDAVLSLGNMLSTGSLAAGGDFGRNHDDLLLRLFCDRNRAGLGGRWEAPADSMEIRGVYQPPRGTAFGDWLNEDAPPNPLLTEEDGRSRVIIVRVSISRSAANEDDNWWRIPATQCRLAYPDGRNFYPVAYLTSPHIKDPHARSMDQSQIDQWQMWTPRRQDDDYEYGMLAVMRPSTKRKRITIDWVYRLPAVEEPDVADGPEVAEAPEADGASDMPTTAEAPENDETVAADDETVAAEEDQVARPTPERARMYLVFRRACERPLPAIERIRPPEGDDPDDRPLSNRHRPADEPK
jgi:hypothetical protein